MAQVVRETLGNAQQNFWQAPAVSPTAVETALPVVRQTMADACADCGMEFMIGARFCHACGLGRPLASALVTQNGRSWNRNIVAVKGRAISVWSGVIVPAWHKVSFPRWMQYLHFHEIQRWIGLPTASLVAFIVGLGCVAGMIGVSVFYKASNLAEFQAIQMWRIEWLLGATAAFVAGILLKKPSDRNRE